LGETGLWASLELPYLWRGWQPIVSPPGADGGSTMRLSLNLKLNNASNAAQRVCWRAIIEVNEGSSYPVTLARSENQSRALLILGSSTDQQFRLVAHGGSYFPASSNLTSIMMFSAGDKPMTTLKTQSLTVHRTDQST
jgi:hypothetical protein